MNDGYKNVKIFLLVILTLAAITLAVVESMRYYDYRHRNGEGEGFFYAKDNNSVIYRGEIVPEDLLTRSQRVASMQKTTMQFYESKYDFGAISEGQVVRHAFRFKNTGQNPLMIGKTDVTCGCTVPEYPDDAISPGSDGEITVVFSSAGKSGIQQKTVSIHANTVPETITISIQADVR
jgi:Protein of unknown function (DUF1573)